MNKVLEIVEDSWTTPFSMEKQAELTSALEADKLLYFKNLAFKVLKEESPLLLHPYPGLKAKNISYDAKTGQLRGIECDLTLKNQLTTLLSRFSQQAKQLIDAALPHYRSTLQIGRTSYRPIEVAGRRPPSYKKDDTRLHVDAFPSSPVQGKRILRVFSNIDPAAKPRLWHIGENFELLAKQFLPRIPNPLISGAILKRLKITRSTRTLYDHIMLNLHDRMKKDEAYQNKTEKTVLPLASGSSWIVQTDSVSHAVISGQHLLEQTFYLPHNSMQNPNASPLCILEKLTGKPLL